MAFVKTEVQGAVEIITIDRPKALNALNPEVLADLKAAFEAVDQETIRCIVLTGEGDKSFVAGADIGSMSTMTKAEGEAFGKLGNDVFLMIEILPIPTIAAVCGFALGGGNELAMSCDIRICSDNAVFGQPEVGLGITPGFGGTQRLARLVGMGMAKQLVYSALNIKADEAYRIGLVNAVYPQAELMENVLKPHQQVRIEVLLGLKEDLAGAGYNVHQSKIAIGSGGLTGKGFLNGTQTKLDYVPEQDTDFIFCTIGEEQGFMGSTFVMVVFIAFILRLMALAERQDDRFGRAFGYSLASIFFFHFAINIGMVIGITPVIGIPLPFFSYGGSSFLGFSILLFTFLRIDADRETKGRA